MKRYAFTLALALAGVLALPATAVAGLGFEVDVLWSPDRDNDAQIFLHASNQAYPAPRERVVAVFNQIPDPYEDYPVVAFIAYNARVDPRAVWAYRARGHAWLDCVVHFGLRPDVLFVRLPSDPGPPYGNAYGHWRKRGNRVSAREVSDDDVRFWVRTHTVARYTGVSPARAFELHRQGRGLDKVAGANYREKQGHRATQAGGKGQSAGFGPPKGKHGGGEQKGKGKGKNKDGGRS